jgi:hypothetical protein
MGLCGVIRIMNRSLTGGIVVYSPCPRSDNICNPQTTFSPTPASVFRRSSFPFAFHRLRANSMSDARPHPNPLPRGEGEVVAASLKIPAAGLVAAQINIRNRARYVLSQGERNAKSRFDQVRAGVKTNFFVAAERPKSKKRAMNRRLPPANQFSEPLK